MRPISSVIGALVLVTAGCGNRDDTASAPRTRVSALINPAVTPFVNSLEVDESAKRFLLTTNRGFFSVDRQTSKVTRINGQISAGGRSDTVGTFLEIEPDGKGGLLGSGHPDHQNTLPQFLGLIHSRDGGKTWRSVSRMGNADLHKIVLAHGRIYAFDAVLSALLVSSDEGKTFSERFTPPGIVVDFVVDPSDPDYLLASTENRIYRSRDAGNRWRTVAQAGRARLAWPESGRVLRADQDGKIYESTDKGVGYSMVSEVNGEPYKLEAMPEAGHLFLALGDGKILETTDGAKTWTTAFDP